MMPLVERLQRKNEELREISGSDCWLEWAEDVGSPDTAEDKMPNHIPVIVDGVTYNIDPHSIYEEASVLHRLIATNKEIMRLHTVQQEMLELLEILLKNANKE
jgi:hypothetical protein